MQPLTMHGEQRPVCNKRNESKEKQVNKRQTTEQQPPLLTIPQCSEANSGNKSPNLTSSLTLQESAVTLNGSIEITSSVHQLKRRKKYSQVHEDSTPVSNTKCLSFTPSEALLCNMAEGSIAPRIPNPHPTKPETAKQISTMTH